MSEKFYVTTPIYYPNGKPHIGHAYNAIATDVIARFARSQKKETFFLSGTDEHGLKMQQTASQQNISPQELADRNSAIFKEMLEKLNCSNDYFIRTTSREHHKTAQALWKRMEDNGDIYLDHYKGWYSVRQEAYYDEKDTILKEDGIRYEKELGSPVEWNEEESYFFRLSNYQEKLLDLYSKKEDFIAPRERRNEVISFVKSGLKDISVSRTTFNWGVVIPENPKHVMYVWVDALANYISALGFPDENNKKWDFWPADLHIIGKDIIRFHAIFWPAFLMSASLALPKKIFAHGFLLNQGEKMSKSVGNVIDPFEMIDRYGLDQVRYFLMRDVPFGQDGSYNHDLIANRVNSDLANDLGNLIQRCVSMVEKHCDLSIPPLKVKTDVDKALLEDAKKSFHELCFHMEKQEIHLALGSIFYLISQTNRYFASQEPWSLKKVDLDRFHSILYITLETLRKIGIMLLPFLPEKMEKLLDSFQIDRDKRSFSDIDSNSLLSGEKILKIDPLFPRYLNDSLKA